MDQPSTSGMNQSTSEYIPDSPSKMPSRASKRKAGGCTQESQVKLIKYVPREVIEPIIQISDDEIYPEERVKEIIPHCNEVQDIRMFFKRFQDFNEKMVALNQSMYHFLGLPDDYSRLENQLSGFLGELHYYREREEARNTYNS